MNTSKSNGVLESKRISSFPSTAALETGNRLRRPSAASRKPKTRVPRPALQRQLTLVRAHIDVGFGNTLYIRGQGNGLSWDKGIALACIAPATWVWATAEDSRNVTFKLLLNDELWAQGGDVVVPAGESIEIVPVF